MVIGLATAAVCLLVLAGEAWHSRRIRRIARLAFGPRARAAAWTRAVPLLRVVASGLMTWGLATLLTVEPKVHKSDAIKDEEMRNLLIVLDVSPSMRLADAGPTQKQARQERARDVLDSLFSRVSLGHYKISVIATYTGAKPVVIGTQDSEVVRNILTDLPMHYAFRSGKTKLFAGLEEAASVAKAWRAKSTILIVISDGDTVPATGMPQMPPSVAEVLVIGVGDPMAGTFIDGRQSRQDTSTLRQIATRLDGVFHDGNAKHLPTDTIRQITDSGGKSMLERLTLREYALLAVLIGAALLAVLPLLLHFAGTLWRPGVPATGAAPAKTATARPAAAARRQNHPATADRA